MRWGSGPHPRKRPATGLEVRGSPRRWLRPPAVPPWHQSRSSADPRVGGFLRRPYPVVTGCPRCEHAFPLVKAAGCSGPSWGGRFRLTLITGRQQAGGAVPQKALHNWHSGQLRRRKGGPRVGW